MNSAISGTAELYRTGNAQSIKMEHFIPLVFVVYTDERARQ